MGETPAFTVADGFTKEGGSSGAFPEAGGAMSNAEIFLLAGTGYICGLAVSSGFILSALLQLYVKGKAAWRTLFWAAYMIANTVVAGLIPIFLIGVLVVGDHPNRPDFWSRALLLWRGHRSWNSFCLALCSSHQPTPETS